MPRRQNARLHCFQRMARFFNGVKQLTANVDRENIQVQRKCAQTLFSASHNFPSTKMQQKPAAAARDQIHNNSVSCDQQFLETVQLSIKRNLHNPQSRVRQFYDSARRKTWKSVPIYSVTVLYSVKQCQYTAAAHTKQWKIVKTMLGRGSINQNNKETKYRK